MLLFRTLLALAVIAPVASAVVLSSAQLSQLAGETSNAVPEIRAAREIAAQHGAILATYGGTSREILTFVQTKVDELGSVEAYRKWLKEGDGVHLLDWHRLASDLDLMLIPQSGQPLNNQQLRNFHELIKQVQERFPESVLFKSFDVVIAQEFFAKFPPGAEHEEAISNIPISERGVERIAEIEKLTESGLKQFASKRLVFRVKPSAPSDPVDTYGDLRQVLRWIRYASENPEMELPEASANAIRELLARALKRDRAGVIKLLQQKDDRDLGRKTLGDLEKLQIYSRDSQKTYALLKEFGIEKIAQEAGVAQARIFEPLGRGQVTSIPPGAKRLGKQITVYHRTTLAAAQNVSKGALWKSNDQSIIGGKRSRGAMGSALYAAELMGAPEYGEVFVAITLDADAIEGKDYEYSNGYYALKDLAAIAVDANGRPMIQEIDHSHFIQSLTDRLEVIAKSGQKQEDTSSVLRALGSGLSPFQSEKSQRRFEDVWKLAKRLGHEDVLLFSLLKQKGSIPRVMSGTGAFETRLAKHLEALFSRGVQNEVTANVVYQSLLDPGLTQKRPALAKAAAQYLTPRNALWLSYSLEDTPDTLQVFRRHAPEVWTKMLENSFSQAGKPFPYRFIDGDPQDQQAIRSIFDRFGWNDFHLSLNPGFFTQAPVRAEIAKVINGWLPTDWEALKKLERIFYEDPVILSKIRAQMESIYRRDGDAASFFSTHRDTFPEADAAAYKESVNKYIQDQIDEFLKTADLRMIEQVIEKVDDETAVRKLVEKGIGISKSPKDFWSIGSLYVQHHPRKQLIFEILAEHLDDFKALNPTDFDYEMLAYTASNSRLGNPAFEEANERAHRLTGAAQNEGRCAAFRLLAPKKRI